LCCSVCCSLARSLTALSQMFVKFTACLDISAMLALVLCIFAPRLAVEYYSSLRCATALSTRCPNILYLVSIYHFTPSLPQPTSCSSTHSLLYSLFSCFPLPLSPHRLFPTTSLSSVTGSIYGATVSRTCVRCSYAYAREINFASVKWSPRNERPKGKSVCYN